MSNPAPLQHGQYYHIYNRGINRETIFAQERNYRHFLRLYAQHVGPIADTFAYCLLPNHFHFLVRIRSLAESLEAIGKPGLSMEDVKKPSQACSNLFNAYAKAYNRAMGRTGSLFQRPFGRVLVTTDAYFSTLVAYIHQNPHKHGLVDDFQDWPFSSYQAHLSERPTNLRRDEVLAWFDGRDGYAAWHQEMIGDRRVAALVPEDFA